MKFATLQDLIKRRRRLAKTLERLPPASPRWPEYIQTQCEKVLRQEIADIDQEIAERTASRPDQ